MKAQDLALGQQFAGPGRVAMGRGAAAESFNG